MLSQEQRQIIALQLAADFTEEPNPCVDLHKQVVARLRSGYFDEAARLCQESYHLGLETANSYARAVSRFYAGLAHFILADHTDWDRAADYCEECANLLHGLSKRNVEGIAWQAVGRIAEAQCENGDARWHRALSAYLKVTAPLTQSSDELMQSAEEAYSQLIAKSAGQTLSTHANFGIVPEEQITGAPSAGISYPSELLDEYAHADPTFFQMPILWPMAYFALCGVAGLGMFVWLLDLSLWPALLIGFVVTFFGPFIVAAVIFYAAGQLRCAIPPACLAISQYRQGMLGQSPTNQRVIWIVPLIERVRAIVPTEERLFLNLEKVEFITPKSVHVVANIKGTYQVIVAIRLVFHFKFNLHARFLGLPRPLSREQVTKEVENQLRTLMTQVISEVVANKAASEILQQQRQIRDNVHLAAKKAAATLGIAIYSDLEIQLYVN